MIQAPGQGAARGPSQKSVPGSETSGKVQDQGDRFYLRSGQGAPGDPPVRVSPDGVTISDHDTVFTHNSSQ